MTVSLMFDAMDNLTRMARGPREYGKTPILRRARGYWELQWIFRGGSHPYTLSGSSYQGETPCLYLHHPASEHGWTAELETDVSEVFVMHFRSVPGELASRVGETKPLMIELGASEFKSQSARLGELWRLKQANDPRLGLKAGQLLIEVALQVMGLPVTGEVRGKPDNRVEQALHWFAENLGENPSADEVARAVGVSPPHLRRLFAAAGRGAPRQELARIRMEAAQRCLREGWRLERIARYFGFSEASAFSRAFAAVCGVAPTEWLSGAGRKSGRREAGGE